MTSSFAKHGKSIYLGFRIPIDIDSEFGPAPYAILGSKISAHSSCTIVDSRTGSISKAGNSSRLVLSKHVKSKVHNDSTRTTNSCESRHMLQKIGFYCIRNMRAYGHAC